MNLPKGQFDRKKIISAGILFVIGVVAAVYVVHYNRQLDEKESQFDSLRETESVEAVVIETTETEEIVYCEELYDFEDLKETNADIYAWITVPGTQVDYPVLQSETDNYYLDHNLEHSGGYPGCIYSNLCTAKDFSDYNTVLYGHNMKNGSMFGCLHEFEDADFFEENRLIYVYTPEKRLTYEIYAAVKFSDVYIPAYYSVTDAAGKNAFLSEVLAACEESEVSHVQKDREITGEERLITLSTCVKGESSKRYLVVGVLTEETLYKN